MEGKVDSSGTCTLSYNPSQGDALLSPDGSQQLLPCERCGAPKWVHVRVVSFLCSACDEEMDGGVWSSYKRGTMDEVLELGRKPADSGNLEELGDV